MENEANKSADVPALLQPPGPTATDRTLDLYARGADNASGLQKEVKDMDTERRVALEQERAAVSNQQFTWCTLQKSQASGQEYEGLMNGVTIIAKQDALEIDKTIGQYVAQAATVKTSFTTLIQSLQNLKTALTDVETTAYQVSELLENSSTTAADDEQKWLNKYITNFSDRVREIGGDTGEKNPKQRRPPRQGLADLTNDLADDAFEVSVKVIGISESANVPSLTDLSKMLVTDVTALEADVSKNVAFAQSQKQETQGILAQMLAKQRLARAETFRKEHQYTALQKTLGFVQDPDCPDDGQLSTYTREQLERIQHAVEESFQ
ncbi:hypothetical protein [Spirosoma validum]|uniref:Uncharacterized protein n=1 Tax=Spirosoma validum TaxID=2771355 RepID=A0A927GD15_9BACT|nr:hypothetical protein [Spirosoma validum]MBD2753203.1 hypothetical protein [Spirosoma validum]